MYSNISTDPLAGRSYILEASPVTRSFQVVNGTGCLTATN